MGLPPTAIVESLRRHVLFADLDEAAFAKVLQLLRVRRLSEGELLFAVGDHDCNLYVVRSGKLALRTLNEQGLDPITRVLTAGDVFNEYSFLSGHVDEQSVEALSTATLWFIPRDAFQGLLARDARLREHVARLTPHRPMPRKLRSQIYEGEQVLWFGRRHALFFLGKIALPTVLLVLSLALVLLSFLEALAAFGLVLRGVSALMALAALGWLAWQVLDYYNDYFLVTEERVVHHERIVLLYDHREELLLDRVQQVEVERGTFLDTLFDLGDVVITAQGANTTVRFDHVRNPAAIGKLILDATQRARHRISAGERARIRAALRARMGITAPSAPRASPALPASPSLLERLRAWFARVRYEWLPRVQVVRGDAIVYRRHWLILLKGIAAPTFMLGGAVGLLAVGRMFLPSLFTTLLSWPFSALVVPILLALVVWWLWCYEDWRNDVFVITSDRILDVKRTPWGILGTRQRAAELRNVQNTTVTTRGIIDVIFNVGDVSIRTAGMENELLFDRVWNPLGIQAEINRRVQQVLERAQRQQAEQRRQELAEWLGIYDELTRLHARPPLL
ncbi:MAG: cyclic nucleotide-binding domain-containing protein [Anaerolineae bacterium]|nr:cyclic nucleotide-binding domain-containing protein [Thermoflexales bacterium]MDW8053368.1 cyclic nucleotide-binding domain-containing protein [Anaerolineae bacterium]